MSGKAGTKSCSVPSPSFEGLEPKLLLAGDVTAYVAGGSLFVVGDTDSNDVVVVKYDTGSFEVKTGTHDATTINGGSDPVDFTGVTGDINASLGAGDDRFELTTGSATVSALGDGGDVTGNVLVNDVSGDNRVSIHDVNIDGSVMVVNGPGTQDIKVKFGTIGSLYVSNAGEANVPVNVGDSSNYATELSTYELTVLGDVNVYNGLGNDKVHFASTSIGGNTLISNGLDGASVSFWDCELGNISALAQPSGGPGGNLSIFKGPGGDVGAPYLTAAGSVGDSDDVDVSGYLKISSTDISGSVFYQGSIGAEEFYLNDFFVAGTVFLDGSAGPLAASLDNFEIDGSLIIKGEGTTDLLPTPAEGIPAGQPSEELSTIVYIGVHSTVSVGSDSLEPTNYVGGDTLLWMAEGNDGADIADTEFAGNVYVIDGNDGAAVEFSGCVLDQSLLFAKGEGGDLGLFGGTAGLGQVGIVSSAFGMFNTEVAGNVTLLNGTGNDVIGFADGCFISGNVFVFNGVGAVEFGMMDAEVDGFLTIINLGGPAYAPVSDPVSAFNTEIGIGVDPSTASVPTGTSYNTLIKGNVTILNGAGNDLTEISDAEIDGNVFIFNGPDGAALNVSNSLVEGCLIDLRGDGGGVPVPGVGIIGTASLTTFTGSEIGGFTLIVNGAGDDEVDSATTTFDGDVSIFNGLDDQYVDLAGAFEGNVTIIDTVSSESDVYMGGNSSSATAVAGNLTIWTGFGDDSVRTRTTSVGGFTDIRTANGDDTVAIDDSAFTGAVAIDTGVPDEGALSDADTINIEQLASTASGTTFSSTLTMSTGDDDDVVNIGVADTSGGVGDVSNEAYAHCVQGFSLDGGVDNDTLNYLENGNQIDVAPTVVNVETIV